MIFCGSIPRPAPADIIAWADSSGIKVDGHSFDSTRTPQLIEPMRAMADADTRIGTLIKPVQVGGSTAGELVCAYWAAFYNGLIQYNWQDDLKAKDRWEDRILPALESCSDIKRTGRRYEELICEARYVNSTVRVQGVFNESALDSDTVPLQINEEVHLWKPGFLGKARRRQTQVWNAKAFDISNASNENDQLHIAYEEGTQERWEIKCPHCGQWHEMRFRFTESKPELGGLRWDSDGCKMPNGRFNYNKLESTIRYQFPCGGVIRDVASERRRMVGRYSQPQNEGAHVSHRSWNFEAVSCDSIRWLTLIQEWHQAIRAMKTGDDEPMRRFTTERECRFWNTDKKPFTGQIVTSIGVTKRREGIPNRAARLWKADWQQGYKHLGQLEHFWLVIKDVDSLCNDLLVYEGRIDSENELLATLEQYDCIQNGSGVLDCSFNTKHLANFVYKSCKQYAEKGISASIHVIMSNESHRGGFLHREDNVRRYYDEGSPLHLKLNVSSLADTYGSIDPIVLNVNKGGMIANHFFIREMKKRVCDSAKEEGREALPSEYIECVIPEDVSDDFKTQYDSWQRVGKEAKKKQDEVTSGLERFQQIRKDDHLLICCAGIDMLKDWTGILGERLQQLGIKPETNEQK